MLTMVAGLCFSQGYEITLPPEEEPQVRGWPCCRSSLPRDRPPSSTCHCLPRPTVAARPQKLKTDCGMQKAAVEFDQAINYVNKIKVCGWTGKPIRLYVPLQVPEAVHATLRDGGALALSACCRPCSTPGLRDALQRAATAPLQDICWSGTSMLCRHGLPAMSGCTRHFWRYSICIARAPRPSATFMRRYLFFEGQSCSSALIWPVTTQSNI